MCQSCPFGPCQHCAPSSMHSSSRRRNRQRGDATMRRRTMAVQEDLFQPDGPAVSMSIEQREDLIDLISELILEVMTNPDTAAEGDDHAPDYG